MSLADVDVSLVVLAVAQEAVIVGAANSSCHCETRDDLHPL
jgi:hypothetical protein